MEYNICFECQHLLFAHDWKDKVSWNLICILSNCLASGISPATLIRYTSRARILETALRMMRCSLWTNCKNKYWYMDILLTVPTKKLHCYKFRYERHLDNEWKKENKKELGKVSQQVYIFTHHYDNYIFKPKYTACCKIARLNNN